MVSHVLMKANNFYNILKEEEYELFFKMFMILCSNHYIYYKKIKTFKSHKSSIYAKLF